MFVRTIDQRGKFLHSAGPRMWGARTGRDTVGGCSWYGGREFKLAWLELEKSDPCCLLVSLDKCCK